MRGAYIASFGPWPLFMYCSANDRSIRQLIHLFIVCNRVIMASSDIELEDETEYEESSVEMLMDFLHKINVHHLFPEILRLFTAELNVEDCLSHAHPYVENYEEQFKAIIESSIVEIDNCKYIHVADLSSSLSKPQKRLLKKGLDKVALVNARDKKDCPLHNCKCDLLRYPHSFLIYLDINKGNLVKEVGIDVEEPTQDASREEDDPQDVIEEVDLGAERSEAQKIDVPALRCVDTEVALSSRQQEHVDDEGDIPLFALPSFSILDQDYFLLIDIQGLFDLREDYCLAILAQHIEEDSGFIDDSNIEKYALLDSHVKDSEFIEPAQALTMLFNDAARYERTVPTEEEFVKTQQSLGISDWGRTHLSTPSSRPDDNTTINIWGQRILEDDENQKVLLICYLYYHDSFHNTTKMVLFIYGFV